MIPSKIHLHKASKTLELEFNKESFVLPAEYLRVYSTSAEVKGHGPGQEVLVAGKINVAIVSVAAVGNYGLKIVFDDGHDSGIYTWNYLHELGIKQDEWWQDYLQRLQQSGQQRDPHTSVIQFPSL